MGIAARLPGVASAVMCVSQAYADSYGRNKLLRSDFRVLCLILGAPCRGGIKARGASSGVSVGSAQHLTTCVFQANVYDMSSASRSERMRIKSNSGMAAESASIKACV